jgi:hypothetical protein
MQRGLSILASLQLRVLCPAFDGEGSIESGIYHNIRYPQVLAKSPC